ncbi:MAG TPA: aldo/keto reductase [Acetobacteraceae bacterium]|nr:aldo/keto reductase [Acetobacteraceae bacterium]
MEHRPLGRSGLSTAPIVFGGNVFGWTADEATSFALLDAFVAGGFNCIDTADSYSRWVAGHAGGESETVIGKWLKRRGKRDDVLIATKVGSDMGQGICLKRDYILRSAEESLKRLQTDYIDLYQEHFDDEVTPVEETMEAFATLIRQGKVRAIGASNITPARLTESLAASAKHGWPRYETLQPHYNLVERTGFERDYAPLCREHGLGVIPYWSLAAGFLTGKYRSEADLGKSPRGPRNAQKYLNDRGLRVLAALDKVASGAGATPAQVALAWLMAQPTITAPIASATSIAQWQDLARAADLKLGEDAVRLLNEASA